MVNITEVYISVSDINFTNSGSQRSGINIAATCTDRDTESDGIPDRLDLDSDNDLCPDAVEGGDNVNMTQLAPAPISPATTPQKWSINVLADGSATATYANVVDAQGVPKIVNTGGIANVDGLAQGQTVNSGAPYNAAINGRCFVLYQIIPVLHQKIQNWVSLHYQEQVPIMLIIGQ